MKLRNSHHGWLTGAGGGRGAAPALQPSSVVLAVRQRGFTMIELLVVVSIGAILAMIAVPSFRDMLNTTRQKSALGLLASDLNLARAEAIKRNTRMLVCVRNEAGTDCANGTNWQAGWVVCADATTAGITPELPPSDGTCDASVAATPNPIAVRPALDPNLTLTASAAVIRFNANSSQGAGATTTTHTMAGTWAGAPTRYVCVANTGNIYTKKPGDPVCP